MRGAGIAHGGKHLWLNLLRFEAAALAYGAMLSDVEAGNDYLGEVLGGQAVLLQQTLDRLSHELGVTFIADPSVFRRMHEPVILGSPPVGEVARHGEVAAHCRDHLAVPDHERGGSVAVVPFFEAARLGYTAVRGADHHALRRRTLDRIAAGNEGGGSCLGGIREV